jgi:diguanylate cyclase (GGDEF)-like protein
LFDLLLIAAVAGMAAMDGVRLDRRWSVLVGGLLVFAAADVVYALRLERGIYAVGTPLDAGWAAGLALVAFWVDGAARSHDPAARPGRGSVMPLAVPVMSTAAGLGVLLVGTRVEVSTLAVALAGVTLLAAAARTQFAFRQLVRMADLRRQAATDDLTGLPNRRALYAALRGRLEEAVPRRSALLVLDLDRFKEVNDSLGHHVGDQLLLEVGTRMRDALRSEDLLARLGGDEFAVLLDGADEAHALAVAGKLRTALTAPFTLEGIALHTGASIGISLFPDHGDDLSTLLRKADMAMYKAKSTRTGHQVYTLSDDPHGDARLRTLEELRSALDGDQLVLHYQPKVDLATGAVGGVEALVRWDHPVRGLLYPGDFLDLIEDAGLMRRMTQVVLESALDQAAEWRRCHRPLTVAVNLSASSLVDADLPGQVDALLRARDLPARSLQLEITEEFLMTDRGRARAILTELRQNGIQIAVDDFGTGYSSLSYLRDLPIDELKLDRSFVFPMADDARAAALVASTVALAHSLGLRMVAEGVENQVSLAELTRYGCDEAQGYLLARPMPAAELDHWLTTRDSRVAHGVLEPLPPAM